VREHLEKKNPEGVAAVYGSTQIEELLSASDYVLLWPHRSTQATRGLMNADRLAAMRPDAYLINVGRGAQVDEMALGRRATQPPHCGRRRSMSRAGAASRRVSAVGSRKTCSLPRTLPGSRRSSGNATTHCSRKICDAIWHASRYCLSSTSKKATEPWLQDALELVKRARWRPEQGETSSPPESPARRKFTMTTS